MQIYVVRLVEMVCILDQVYVQNCVICVKVILIYMYWQGLEWLVFEVLDWWVDNLGCVVLYVYFDVYVVLGYFDGGMD